MKHLTIKFLLGNPDASVVVVPTIAHRVTIRFRHKKTKLSDQITNTNPAYDKVNGIGVAKTDIAQIHVLKSEPQNNDASSRISADMVNDFTNQVISLTQNHPINLTDPKKFESYELYFSQRCR